MTSKVTQTIRQAAALLRQLRERLQARFPAVHPAHWPAMATLAIASSAACVLWVLRVIVQERPHHAFLPWNLFLAWLPMLLSLATLHLGHRHGWRSWKPWLAGTLWLVFFPNAPYIFTDLSHLQPGLDHKFWMDLIMILLFAWPGFLIGCLSLKILHAPVAGRFGMATGWLFVGVVCGLAGVGVYVGRFLRWNSWDIIIHPVGVGFDLLGFFSDPAAGAAHRFSILFGILLFIGYATIQPFARIPQASQPR